MNVFDVLREKFNERHTFYENRFSEMGGTDRDVEDWGSIKSYADAIDIVNQVEQEYSNGWIPCSERLPEDTGEYIVTIDGATRATTLSYDEVFCNWTDDDCLEYPVIAWQPLPEPFRENDIPRKQTNADRIRSMTDEELADEMLKFPDVCEQAGFCKNDILCNDTLDRGETIEPEMCKRCLMNWLRKEAK